MVDFATSIGGSDTATSGTDFTATSGTLVFNQGVSTQTFTVTTIDDALIEGDETFTVSLSNPTAGAVLGSATASGTIIDNDAAGSVVTAIDVSLLNGGDINADGTADGLKLNGVTGNSAASLGDNAGTAVSIAGDINGDGLADLAIGAYLRGAGLNGAVYAVFGSTSLSALANGTSGFDLGLLNGTQGLTLLGGATDDRTGQWVAAGGDLDGNGYADLVFGDSRADSSAPIDPPEAHVLSGAAAVGSLDSGSGFSVSGFNGSNGANLSAEPSATNTPLVVTGIGDVDNDGMDDFMVGQRQDTPNGTDSGRAWLVFGDADGDGIPDHNLVDIANLDLTTASPAMGVLALDGPAADANIGRSIAAIGDINGDGLDDFLLGSAKNSGDKGAAYILFGDSRANLQAEFSAIDSKTGAYAPSGNNGGLEALNGANGGVTLTSDSAFFTSQGKVVSGIGDFNGDGFDDFAVTGTETSGAMTTVVFGHAGPWTNLNLFSDFNSVAEAGAGFHIAASAGANRLGVAVSGGGDVNGDGYDDLIIGEPGTNSAYVLFGTADIAPFITTGGGFIGSNLGPIVDIKPSGGSPFDSGGVLFGQGLILNGVSGIEFGASASIGGDVNGDGYADILVGAPSASPPTSTQFGAGQSYLIYGQDFSGGIPVSPVSQTATANGQAIVGTRLDDPLLSSGSHSNVSLRGGNGNDVLAINGTERGVDGGGGDDTLTLSQNNLVLDFTAIASDNVYQGVERIDMSGNGTNGVTLDIRDVLHIADTSHSLFITGDAGTDSVTATGFQNDASTVVDGGITYNSYSGPGTSALLLIDQNLLQSVTL